MVAYQELAVAAATGRGTALNPKGANELVAGKIRFGVAVALRGSNRGLLERACVLAGGDQGAAQC